MTDHESRIEKENQLFVGWRPMVVARMKIDPESSLPDVGSRLYVIKGKRWPRLYLGVYPHSDDPKQGIDISCSMKRSPKSWWINCPIPLELVGETIELLREAQNRLGVIPWAG